ncbi:MAG: efflux RND transporter permease subunit [Acidobacteriota bacterium]|nr:efflux RND transporter permease subunit [Blastocatellia bacterium]MDW8412694.1 efflux RND transporter permease subunit [Acidobacteriota bacterium]
MNKGFAGRLAAAFIDSKLTLLLVLASIGLGIGAVLVLPREEEPQIVVPMIDVFVEMPGATAAEVENRVTRPMEKLIWEIPGVEYIYSTVSPGRNLTVVRFRVGENEEDAIVRLNQKMFANFDLIPPGASRPLIKPRSIDDVPFLALTLWSYDEDHFALRRVAAELHDYIKEIPDVSEVKIIGGLRRQLRVVLDGGKLASRGLSAVTVAELLRKSNLNLAAGSFSRSNEELLVEVGNFLSDAEAVGQLVISTSNGSPVYLRDVAAIEDGPEEPSSYVFHSFMSEGRQVTVPAVTISVAKRKGTNATDLAEAVINKVELLRGRVIPSNVNLAVTRNYGHTAKEKSDELLLHMIIAIVSVSVLIWLTLGLRESGIVAIAIPVTLALTLVIFYLYGYTLNRVTLFALIFAIGILVDDAIVVVENIVRHYRLPENAGRSIIDIAVDAVDEVGNPTILATFAVIAAILPMAFVRGLMGPYMRPIPIGASAAMVFSLLIAFIVTPWASLKLLKREAGHEHKESASTRLYRKLMHPLIASRFWRSVFLVAVVVLLAATVSLLAFKAVMVKMLPFDNKSEFQVIIDLPEGSTLEETAAVADEISRFIATSAEVANIQMYVGTSSPYNFNGLVRHYFLRSGSNVADLQVNLIPKAERKLQSHDIAKQLRPQIQQIAARYAANVKVAEVPPGPPVLQTLVAEIYGPDATERLELAQKVKQIFEQTEDVVDVDWYVEDEQRKYFIEVDREKAQLSGVELESVVMALKIALGGEQIGLLHQISEKEDLPIIVRLDVSQRSSLDDLLGLRVEGSSGSIALRELVKVRESASERNIYRKNLMNVVYVTADVAGRAESPVYAILKLTEAIAQIKTPEGYSIAQYTATQPQDTDQLAIKWDGEWHITYEVFRDLGIAFALVLVLIYVLTVGWFHSFKTPLVIMAAIPFSLVGILPAHWAMGAFFTATSMIGFIAGAGIVVRNSIILVDFIELRLRQGMPLAEAVIDAGAVRFRPMLLTAAAVIVGASVILFDPIFQGLALSLMAGEVASLLLSRLAVPVLYYMSNAHD